MIEMEPNITKTSIWRIIQFLYWYTYKYLHIYSPNKIVFVMYYNDKELC